MSKKKNFFYILQTVQRDKELVSQKAFVRGLGLLRESMSD